MGGKERQSSPPHFLVKMSLLEKMQKSATVHLSAEMPL